VILGFIFAPVPVEDEWLLNILVVIEGNIGCIKLTLLALSTIVTSSIIYVFWRVFKD